MTLSELEKEKTMLLSEIQNLGKHEKRQFNLKTAVVLAKPQSTPRKPMAWNSNVSHLFGEPDFQSNPLILLCVLCG